MFTEKVAIVELAATVTLAGTVAAAVLLLVSVTTAPPDGAGPLSVIVALDDVPPVRLAGFSVKELKLGSVTLIVTVAVLELSPAAVA